MRNISCILNPYAETKFLIEKFLNKYQQNTKFKIVNFRYFNPAGSHQSNLIGDNPKKPITYFHQLIMRSKKKIFKIFGSDYDTKDGTAIKFIHIDDLCDAHLKCFKYRQNKRIQCYEFRIRKRLYNFRYCKKLSKND